MEECQEELEDHIRDVSLVYEDWEEIERGLYVRLQRLVADLLAYTHTLPRNRLHQVSEQRQRFRHHRLGCKQISESKLVGPAEKPVVSGSANRTYTLV